MTDIILILILLLLIAVAILQFMILSKTSDKKLTRLDSNINSLKDNQEKTERVVREEIAKGRQEATYVSKMDREEISGAIKAFSDSLQSRMAEVSALQQNQLAVLTNSNEDKLEKLREALERSLKSIQEDNNTKLEQMRVTVDEKLHATLEKRLGESFKQVSDRLEMVYKGLGEMQTLASGVGDLKKVLSNVKTRGIWGEIQLENILEQILTTDQYCKNVATKKNSADRVEFAIKLPGRDPKNDACIWLPIDAKFPQEDYQRLIEAQEHADAQAAEEAAKSLETRIKSFAKDIRDKYIDPPGTTDFAIMFLPTEGLYAEVLRRIGLSETLQRDYRVIISGPTTLTAILNSLHMGFRTLAIEKRSSEVWSLLGAVKTEFGRFGDLLDKTQKKLQEASNTIEDAARKSRKIERKLKEVQVLSPQEAEKLIEQGEEIDS